MKAIPAYLNVAELEREITSLLVDRERCLIFIDTNILLWLFRLNSYARSQFIYWLENLILQDRLFFPAWVVHEYNSLLGQKNDDLLFPLKKPVKEILRNLPIVQQYANLIIDEDFLKGTKFETEEKCEARKKFLSELSDAIGSIQGMLNCLTFANKVDRFSIREELEPIINQRVLDSDIIKIMSAIKKEVALRFAHHIPPGYEDKKKEENIYGDLIIWKEVLQKCAKDGVSQAILLTNDLKRDWVVKPDFVLVGERKLHNLRSHAKREYYLPAPELIEEFRLHTGSDEFHIVDIELLTSLLGTYEYNPDMYQAFGWLFEAAEIDRKISPTQQVILWFAANDDKLKEALHSVCFWQYEPNEVNFNAFKDWIEKNIPDVDHEKVNLMAVFCEYFL